MSPARRPFKAISVKIVELVGTNQFQMFVTVNIKKFLREYTDQVISANKRDGGMKVRALDPGLKIQGPSLKLQASSAKLGERQATSVKPQAPSIKLQAASFKLHDL